jgi:hypothetical protein
MQISEFTIWLRSRASKHHRPFHAGTIAACTDAARALDQWMTAQGIDGDVTARDTGMLNRFFTGYLASHGQGGTSTRQRNLRHLFSWLERRARTRIRGPRRCTGTRRRRIGRPHWPRSSSTTCSSAPAGAGRAASRTYGTTP